MLVGPLAYSGLPVLAIIAIGLALAALLPLLCFRHIKALWLAIDLRIRPPTTFERLSGYLHVMRRRVEQRQRAAERAKAYNQRHEYRAPDPSHRCSSMPPRLPRARSCSPAAHIGSGQRAAGSGATYQSPSPRNQQGGRPFARQNSAWSASSMSIGWPTPRLPACWTTSPPHRARSPLSASSAALNSGTLEKTTPTESSEFGVRSSKNVGSEPRTPNPELLPTTFAALEALTSRGLIPFLQLSFFPPEVSPSPTLPPAAFDVWQALVRAFLDALVADARFGLAAIRAWWFEVWNEPNIPVFWQGTFDRYLDLYRATSDAVRASGYPIRLGGPALAYLPASSGPTAGAPLMRRFLQFLHDEPDMQCDFLSFHEKGTWVSPAAWRRPSPP